MSIERRYSQFLRSSGAQCVWQGCPNKSGNCLLPTNAMENIDKFLGGWLCIGSVQLILNFTIKRERDT